jgi:hypothetical protein
MDGRIYNWNFNGILGRSVEKLKYLKGSFVEVYYGLGSNNLPCCEMKMMEINGVVKTLV